MKKIIGATLAGALVIGVAGIAYADDVQGDPVRSETTDDFVSSPTVNVGTVCAGSTKLFDVAVRRGGNANANILKGDTELTFSERTAPTGDITVSGYGSVQVPASWDAELQSSDALTPAVTLTITIVKSTVGAFTDSFEVQADGTNRDDGAFHRRMTVAVTGSVQLCGGDAAAAIANAWLNDPANSSHLNKDECFKNGTNKNQSNWRGVIISTIAHEYKGMGSNVNEADVHADVLSLCMYQVIA
jgi:hypothetical protein